MPFAHNAAAVAAVGNAYAGAQVVALSGSVALDARAEALPSQFYLSALELELSAVAGGATTLQALLAWAANFRGSPTGTSTAATIEPVPGDALRWTASFLLDLGPLRVPATGTAGTIYLFLRTNVGTVQVDRARLHWSADRVGRV